MKPCDTFVDTGPHHRSGGMRGVACHSDLHVLQTRRALLD
jgi:hypothetical protein